MALDFVIPVTRDDLLTRSSVNQYVVDEVLPLREIPGALQAFRYALHNPLSITEHFTTAFSVLCLQKELDNEQKVIAWECVLKGSGLLTAFLAQGMDSMGDDAATRQQYLLVLKMHCYLLCQYVELFEKATNPDSQVQINMGKGRGRGKKQEVVGSNLGIDWEQDRHHAMQNLLQLLALNLPRLWDPPVAEEDFVSLVSCCCYKLLENPGVTKVKDTCELIGHCLGMLVQRYNHGLGASLKVIQLLQHFEHVVSPLASAVALMATEYKAKSVVGEIMREIGNMDAKDLAKDTSGTKAFSLFLVELSEKVPQFMLPSISLLVPHLDGESYTMRNAILSVMTEILLRCLISEEIEDKHKTARESFFDKLEDHIHDTNAFVRSKVMQLWTRIINELAMPLQRLQHVTDLVIGRIQDKSSQARKCALQLLVNLLKCNPYTSALSIEDIRQAYLKEKQALEEILPEDFTEGDLETSLQKVETEWSSVEKDLLEVLAEMAVEAEEQSAEEVSLEEDATAESVLESVYQLLIKKKLKEAVARAKQLQEAFPALPVFQIVEGDAEKEPDQEQSMEVDGQGESTEEQQTVMTTYLKKIFAVKRLEELATATAEQGHKELDASLVAEIQKKKNVVQFLEETVLFTDKLVAAMPLICQLLGSKNTSDVFEAIEFFVTAFEFGLVASMQGIRRMLVLIWSQEVGIREAVVAAYRRLYFALSETNPRLRALAIVKNLTALCRGASLGDLTSMEKLVCELVGTGDMDAGVVQVLWERFTLKLPDTSAEESRAALLLLSMAAGAEMEIVKTNIEVLVKEGLGPRGEKDDLLAQGVCLALLKLGPGPKVKGKIAEEPFKLPQDHEMFMRLQEILLKGITNLESRHWIPLAEQVVGVIYKLSEHPDTLSSNLLVAMARRLQELCSAAETEEDKSVVTAVMGRLFAVAGHVALKQLVHLDVAVLGELKRRHALQEEGKKPSNPLETPQPKQGSEAIEEELGLTGAMAEDAEAEFIRKVCEMEIVTGKNLLALLGPVLVAVCTNQSSYPDPQLQVTASLALAKFMMVSSEFCEANLQLLFTILEKSQNPVIRSNLLIALGDLTFRFPNLIEPWTPNLYARLRDPSPLVKKNTLQVLTHLILNDMVKVKGQISELASCMVEEDERIANLAKLFFLELSKKGNAVYNILPDMVSRLSDPDIGVDETHFRTIMRYLLSFIQKDKQCESLVEKLCHRFRATRVERQWRDLAFCLSMLSFSDKAIRKLQDNFACFADKLGDEEVYSCFTSIVNKTRNAAKQDIKVMLDELEQRLEQCHTKGMEEEEIATKASKASKAAAQLKPGKTPARNKKTAAAQGKTPRTGKKVPARRTRRSHESDSDEENRPESDLRDETPVTKDRPRRSCRKARPVLDDDDDDDNSALGDGNSSSSSNPFKTPAPPSSKRSTRSRPLRI